MLFQKFFVRYIPLGAGKNKGTCKKEKKRKKKEQNIFRKKSKKKKD